MIEFLPAYFPSSDGDSTVRPACRIDDGSGMTRSELEFITLVQSQLQLILGTSWGHGDGLNGVIVGWHLNNSFGEDLVDEVALGSYDVPVLKLLNLDRDSGALLPLLPNCGDGSLAGQH